MSRPKLLDLFSGAGGCSVGYHRAGFDVTGVDILKHPDYPFPMILMDAMTALTGGLDLAPFATIAASPPCPRYSTITPDSSRHTHPDLIGPIRDALRLWGGVYVIENVAGAMSAMRNPVKVCGSSFGLASRRHRLFESDVFLMGMSCRHPEQGRPIGVYGDHPQDDEHYRRPDGTRRGNKAKTIEQASEALGIDWMTSWDDLTDAIPPMFTEFLGAQLLAHLASGRVA